MNVKSFRNWLIYQFIEFIFPSYEWSKGLNDRNLYPDKSKIVLPISINKNYSDIKHYVRKIFFFLNDI